MNEISNLLNPETFDANSISIWKIMFTLFLSGILSIPVGWIYMKMHKHEGYDQSLIQTFVLISVIVSAVMLIIGNNLARSIGLIGAVSIIRFRTPVKNPKDTAFIFLSIVIGMSCGLMLFDVAIITLIIMMIYIAFLWKTDFGKFDFKNIK